MKRWGLEAVVLGLNDGLVLRGDFDKLMCELQRCCVHDEGAENDRKRLDDSYGILWDTRLEHVGFEWLPVTCSVDGTGAIEGDSRFEGAWKANNDHLVKSEHLGSCHCGGMVADVVMFNGCRGICFSRIECVLSRLVLCEVNIA